MVLPILVPPDAWRQGAMRARVPSRRPRSRPQRRAEDAQPKATDREALLIRWRTKLRLSPGTAAPSGRARSQLQASGAALSDPADLFDDCVRVLRAFQRHRRRRLPQLSRRALPMIMRSFSAQTSSVRASTDQLEAVAWVLSAMHWCGCRHPVALLGKPIHAPTGLVRWIARFDLREQTDRPHDLIRELGKELRNVDRRCVRLVAAMTSREGLATRTVVVLPELLRFAT